MFKLIQAGAYEFHEDAWGTISEGAKALVRRMLTVDPAQRITASEILSHTWVTWELNPEPEAACPPSNLPSTIERLVKFNAKRKFKAAIMACHLASRMTSMFSIATIVQPSTFSHDELVQIREAFRVASGGENFITLEKFVEVMTMLGYHDHPLEAMYRVFDVDGDQQVDYKEFLLGLGALKGTGEATTRFCFDLYDEDKSGAISIQELTKVIFSVASEEEKQNLERGDNLQRLFEAFDTNHDNQISYEEFKIGIQAHPILVRHFVGQAPQLAPIAAAAVSAPAEAEANLPPPPPVAEPATASADVVTFH